MKKFLKQFIPPIFLRLYRSYRSSWRGDYSSWQEAREACEGYHSETILKAVSESASRVSAGEFPYERDSVLFEKVEYSWPLAGALCWSALRHSQLRVLDFGGGLGSAFYQNKIFLDSIPDLKWFVVEQKTFVNRGKEQFSHDRLIFEESIQRVVAQASINLILVSSTMQYLENPWQTLQELINVGAELIVIDRFSAVEGGRDIITKQTVPNSIYPASYPCRFFNKQILIDLLSSRYELISEFKCFVPNVGVLNGRHEFQDIGFIWKKRTSAIA
jgi:putative methyltransferase (TIGR04325 family)